MRVETFCGGDVTMCVCVCASYCKCISDWKNRKGTLSHAHTRVVRTFHTHAKKESRGGDDPTRARTLSLSRRRTHHLTEDGALAIRKRELALALDHGVAAMLLVALTNRRQYAAAVAVWAQVHVCGLYRGTRSQCGGLGLALPVVPTAHRVGGAGSGCHACPLPAHVRRGAVCCGCARTHSLTHSLTATPYPMYLSTCTVLTHTHA